MREALYDELAPGRRSRLHRRIAETLEVVYAGAGDAHLAELAFHFVQATQMADPDSSAESPTDTRNKAIDYARRAGEQSSRALAYEEASQQFSMALAAMDAGDDAEPQVRAELLLELGDADARTGDLDKARTSFLEAARLARELGSGTLLARAALGFGGRHQWARAGNDTVIVPLLRDALELLGEADDRLRVRLLTRLAGALRSDRTMRNESARLSSEAVELARRIVGVRARRPRARRSLFRRAREGQRDARDSCRHVSHQPIQPGTWRASRGDGSNRNVLQLCSRPARAAGVANLTEA